MTLELHFHVENFRLKAQVHFLFLTEFHFNQDSWRFLLAVKLCLNRAFRVFKLQIN